MLRCYEAIRGANRKVTVALERASGELSCLIGGYDGLLASERQHINAYRGQTVELDQRLATDEGPPADEARIQDLATQVHQLQQENAQLQQSLTSCQENLIRQMAAADAAAESVRVDILTQLPNRRAFEEKVAELQSCFERNGKAYVVVFLDVDRFHQINDTYGHAVGDAVLTMLARVFRENQRSGHHIARFDGEQFAVLLPGSDLEQARSAAEHYRGKVEAASLRFGAVGQHGSLAIIERFILTLKEGYTRRIVVPLQRERFRRDLLFPPSMLSLPPLPESSPLSDGHPLFRVALAPAT